MADTRTKAIKSKIVPGKDLGQPKAVTLLPEGQTRLTMGTVLGYVDKLIQRTMPNGQVYEGFSGFFRAIPADEKLPIVESGICYFPAGFHELIAKPFADAEVQAKEAGAPAPRLNFKFKVEAVKDGNPQGYSWSYTPEIAAVESDPLAHLAAPDVKAISAQPQSQTEAAPKEKAGSRK